MTGRRGPAAGHGAVRRRKALGHAASTAQQQDDSAAGGGEHPNYRSRHGHLSALIAEARPALDADLLAHVLLGALHSAPVLDLLRQGQAQRLSDSLRTLAVCLLDAPDDVLRQGSADGSRPTRLE